MQSIRRFTTTAVSCAAKPTKARAPPKKAAKQSFGKKVKAKDAGGATSTSAFAAKVGSSKNSSKLNPAAPRVELRSASPTICTAENVGTVFETPASVVTQLYALDVLEKQAGYQYFSQLASVLRNPTVELAEMMLRDGSSKDRRVLIDGPPGSGKSILMVQAITLALQEKWVVISIPRAEALVDSTYPYAYDEKRKSWRQDIYMAEMLGRIAEGNKEILKLQNTSKKFSFDRHSIPEKATLHKLLEIGANDPAVSAAVYDAFMSEMDLEGRPSTLFTLDNFSVTTLPSRYRDQDFQAIHPFDLEILKDFTSYLNGTKTLSNGMVIANTSSRPACVPRSLHIALGQAIQSPFEAIDDRIAPTIKDVKVVQVAGYNQEEAKSVVKHYASAGLLRGLTAANIDDSVVLQRTTMGAAIGREVFRSCLKQL